MCACVLVCANQVGAERVVRIQKKVLEFQALLLTKDAEMWECERKASLGLSFSFSFSLCTCIQVYVHRLLLLRAHTLFLSLVLSPPFFLALFLSLNLSLVCARMRTLSHNSWSPFFCASVHAYRMAKTHRIP